ncbi:MAG: hypothetical protein IKR85_02250 [Clostridia bacterium]|nr:hypothetical protein [Clostridia bacterium]
MGIFTPVWRTDKPKKLDAALKYVARAKQAKLREIAQAAPLPEVREKAIGLTEDAAFLLRLFEKEAAARQRYAELASSGDRQALALINQISDVEVLFRLAETQNSARQRIAYLASAGNEQALDSVHDEKMSLSVLEHAGEETAERCSDKMNRLLDGISMPRSFLYLAENAKSDTVRSRAIRRIEDQKLREEVVSSPSVPTELRVMAVDLVKNPVFLKNLVYSGDFPLEIRKKAVWKLTDDTLFAIVCDESIPEELRSEAAPYVKDPSLCKTILMNRKLPLAIRRRKIFGIKDDEELMRLATSDEDYELRKTAVERMKDSDLLMKLRSSDSDIRTVACEKLGHKWEYLYDSKYNREEVAIYKCEYCGERTMMPYE